MIEAIHFKKTQEKLSTPVQFIKGVGPKRAQALEKKGIKTVKDALFFLPYRYEDRSRLKLVRELVPGRKETVMAQVLKVGEIPLFSRFSRGKRPRRIFEVLLRDRGGALFRAKWFHYRGEYLRRSFPPGAQVILYGTVGVFRGQVELIHPETEIISVPEVRPGKKLDFSRIAPMEPVAAEPDTDNLNFGRIVPIYHEVEGIYPRTLRAIFWEIVRNFSEHLVSGVPAEILEGQGLIGIAEAVRALHFPEPDTDLASLENRRSPYHLRMIFEELFLLELGLALRREKASREPGTKITGTGLYRDQFIGSLPFTLTKAQERVVREIEEDLRTGRPMNRLLQGDVGSGKTVVAALASLRAAEEKYQVALMAPTEILAEQHYRNLSGYFAQLPIQVGLLTGSLSRKVREETYRKTAAGEMNVLVGTQALIQEPLTFPRLGLVIIDEQHRFGVGQRARLREKARENLPQCAPHLLVMTATPIPRTLALTLYGDLDVSVIDEMPPGRKPIKTRVYNEEERPEVFRAMLEELKKGSQVFVVYPLIEESEKLDLRDATRMSEDLKSRFPGYVVGLVHGRMKREERDRIMREFREGRIAMLVATTVIEVGIDIPEATLMIIEHAERFGLSQLHQLRGRVGRGDAPSTCILVSGAGPSRPEAVEKEPRFFPALLGEPEAEPQETRAERRLKVMESTNDGFKIAEEDLNIRGPGDIMGTRQSGFPVLQFADFPRDFKILLSARKEAFALAKTDPNLTQAGHLLTRELLKEMWEGKGSVLFAG
ncbi:MAG: ATP-dependent DNA helicase RecG [bacterium]|nr:ATP-dependent DNA helicase RecG [bacterium]